MIACVFRTRAGSSVVLAELARTRLELERGLAGRPWLPRDHGMLFVFDAPGPLRFWMRGTLIPLDMIFVDAGGGVVHVEEDAAPLSLSLRGTDAPAQFVVEVGAGWARAHAVDIGTLVDFYPLDVENFAASWRV
jgi:uncharacterized membrane protein (UPF0127 family)